MKIVETQLGYEIRTRDLLILMGGLQSQLPDLKTAYPDLSFKRLKQIHSDAVLETTSQTEDYQILGDAHFSGEKGLSLCVITADCIPAFFYDPKTQLIAGAHAGWRGVAAKIIPKTIQALKARGAKESHLQVFIGPHIQKSSFEVGQDVRDQILASLGPLSPSERSRFAESISGNKSLVNLHEVVMEQLAQEGVSPDAVQSLQIDTVKDLRFHSHRRDKEKAGRQISFICRL